MRRIRVLIADDHPGFTSALVSVLEADPRFIVAATATTGEEALRLAAETPVDVALLDVHMPFGGPAAAEALAALPYPPALVAISAQSGQAVVEEMLRAGAVGYLTKGRVGAVLPDLLARCVEGEVILATPAAAGALRAVLEAPVARA
ncbi:MAG TPA: response regulator transcription factor [Nocardioidaceae bacterium]|nr:response regulator transcription factor [Nocardioidaceae bacterium]